MKILITLSLIFAAQFANARSIEPQGIPIAAKLSIEYYRNLMPRIIPDNDLPTPPRRNTYSVVAEVEFCATVDRSNFFIKVRRTEIGNIIGLFAKNYLVDCFGPTRKQTLRLPLPRKIDMDRPIFSLLRPQHVGDVQ